MDITIILITSVVVCIFIKLTSKSRQAKIVDKLPGPPSIPVFGSTYKLIFSSKEDIMSIIDSWSKRYGQIYRTWSGLTPTVHISKPEYVECILNNSKHLQKGHAYEFLHPWLGTGLLTSSGQKWFQHRKMITPTFHFKILDTFIEVFNENSKILVKKLNDQIEIEPSVDIYPFITRCALDIICETAMGTKVYAQQKDTSTYVQAIYRVSELTVKRNFYIWLRPDFIFYNCTDGKDYRKNLKILHGFTENVIKERTERRKLNKTEEESKEREMMEDMGLKKRQAFLDLLLDVNTTELQSGVLTNSEIREEVDTFMFEGHDTTTAAVCWSLLLLSQHPKIQEEVYEELKTILGEDVDKQPTMKDLNEMKYLERVIKEALRLYPSVPFITRQLEDDLMIGDHLIPKGVIPVINIRSLHRDPVSFPHPELFNPNHFLPENTQKRHPYAYIPFSAGPRNCIGQKFALLEEKVVLSHLLRNFQFESVERTENLTLLIELVLRPASGIKVRIKSRMNKSL